MSFSQAGSKSAEARDFPEIFGDAWIFPLPFRLPKRFNLQVPNGDGGRFAWVAKFEAGEASFLWASPSALLGEGSTSKRLKKVGTNLF